jgi:hypothetical protein
MSLRSPLIAAWFETNIPGRIVEKWSHVPNTVYTTVHSKTYSHINENEITSGVISLPNIAVGGDWGGEEGVNDTIFPATMEIDYIKVYQR